MTMVENLAGDVEDPGQGPAPPGDGGGLKSGRKFVPHPVSTAATSTLLLFSRYPHQKRQVMYHF